MRQKGSIIFWFDSPPKVGKGAFNFVARNWPLPVYYIFNNDFREERKRTNWDDGDFGGANLIRLYNLQNCDQTIQSFFADRTNIHIVNGFTTRIMRRIQRYIKQKGINLLVLSERPDAMGGYIERIFRELFFQIKYRHLFHSFNPYVTAFLPLGQLGKSVFMKYGWNDEKIFPFMYNPAINIPANWPDLVRRTPLRFLYVGRFYFKTKGVDVLIKAANHLKGEWELDFVGGYGRDTKAVLRWISQKSNVHYLGSWDSGSVVTNMQAYDVVIIPTKYDGWNLLVNEALHAGIGVITTDGAVSHEIIDKSGAGIVIKKNSSKQLTKAIQGVIDDPNIVITWKEKARCFVKQISTPVVGQYLIDIINYTVFNEGTRPQCPWI